MSRPLRIQYPGAVYHVMNRGGARQRTFLIPQDYRAFLQVLEEANERWGAEILAYCLLPNHYHLCLRTPRGNLSRIMRHVDGLYTQRFNRAYRRDGPLFRGRYKAILVEEDSYLASVVRYIHRNPITAGLIKKPQDYAWSSHRAYIQPEKTPSWLQINPVLETFPHRRAFHEFVFFGNDPGLDLFFQRPRVSPILGSEKFVEKVRGQIGRLPAEHPRHQRQAISPSVEGVIAMVCHEYGTSKENILTGRRGRRNEARKVAMYLVPRLCDLTLRETAGKFNLSSYGVVGWNGNGVRMRLQASRSFRNRVESLEARIYQQKI
jgi:REP-associated tyrosine transposase